MKQRLSGHCGFIHAYTQVKGFHSYPLQYLESYSTVVVLQRRDVIVAQSEFSPSVYLRDSQTSDF